MAPQDNSNDLYDNYDQNPNEDSGEDSEDKENVGEPFLAPKASFKGDLSPGTIHRVRIEESHDSELTLVCLGPKAEEQTETMPEEPTNELYE